MVVIFYFHCLCCNVLLRVLSFTGLHMYHWTSNVIGPNQKGTHTFWGRTDRQCHHAAVLTKIPEDLHGISSPRTRCLSNVLLVLLLLYHLPEEGNDTAPKYLTKQLNPVWAGTSSWCRGVVVPTCFVDRAPTNSDPCVRPFSCASILLSSAASSDPASLGVQFPYLTEVFPYCSLVI